MKSRTKLFVAIAAFLIAFGAAVGVTVGVLAARQITVTTPINVGYTSEMVAASLSATYQVTGRDADPVNFLTDNSDSTTTTITFDGEEAQDNEHNRKSFAEPTIPPLTATYKTIVFTFTIHNDTGAEVVATITYPTPTNMTETRTGDSNELNIAANGTETYTLTLTIASVAKDASFSGNISWNLARAS